MDKNKFKDEKGRYIVQGLFLEDRYNKDLAVFTFDGEDKEYKGEMFISLKKRFIEYGDPNEYLFAKEYLYDWDHWQRLCQNKIISRHIEKWREELYNSLRSEGIQTLIDLGTEGKSYQAAKYLAECGWDIQKRGRPSKEEIEGEVKRRANEQEEFNEGVVLLEKHKEKKK
jgi:hypothetical protein